MNPQDQTQPKNNNDTQVPPATPEQPASGEDKLDLSMSLDNMEPNIAAALSYIIPPFTGILIFIMEKGHKFVRFHAFQSILFGFTAWAAMAISGSIPIVGHMLNSFFRITTIVLWLFLMWKAYNKEQFELPFLGKIAMDQVNK